MVSVDNDFARFGAKSYAINKITSVEIREVTAQNAGCMVVLLALGAVLSLAIGIAVPPFLIFTLVFGYGAYLAWKKSKQITYQLFLITAASEQQAYESLDRDDVYSLREQVEAAMMHHSRGGRD
ncbi:hypothetical protein QE363_000763 [Sphingomonas sp. SORGH_AS870]|uniref:DUF6232 family protein n=1 Tax=Sphingomonas sp. SORGH_AS_0870 TaxID=3041801 RepID=UPI00285CA53E|nr:DUF6232 family protein [Sphingomonas sp. SORGH_AS_0870]MDR6144970.1 hypothetical protein [Sphingomonas sp. SORGH_AS_0870]